MSNLLWAICFSPEQRSLEEVQHKLSATKKNSYTLTLNSSFTQLEYMLFSFIVATLAKVCISFRTISFLSNDDDSIYPIANQWDSAGFTAPSNNAKDQLSVGT